MICVKYSDEKANSEGFDMTAPRGAARSGPTLFVHDLLFKYLV